MIIRHGEKVGDPSDDMTGGIHLAIQGSAPAAALPTLFYSDQDALSCEVTAIESSFTGQYEATSIEVRWAIRNYRTSSGKYASLDWKEYVVLAVEGVSKNWLTRAVKVGVLSPRNKGVHHGTH
jgi:hypothetical protein